MTENFIFLQMFYAGALSSLLKLTHAHKKVANNRQVLTEQTDQIILVASTNLPCDCSGYGIVSNPLSGCKNVDRIKKV
jgi:hypothetical protein